jgi:dienelactone hydrolase
MKTYFATFFIVSVLSLRPSAGLAQAYGERDQGEPGDAMIQQYLSRVTESLHAGFSQDFKSLDDWQTLRTRYREEYFYMLGLWPVPAKTPLHATVTSTYQGDGYAVDMLHYQSRPGLYVTANLYRPRTAEVGERLPAILYVCGHSSRGRNGNKTAYQSHGIWFARHGYVCLIVDTLQLGEIAGLHHGTYREGRWWWHSRGYTPAGVECWNGIRGIDYLQSRADVDPDRIGVTGISGGGAATFWIAAADERVKVAVPVSGMADLPAYVTNRVINGHCDCMFLYNTFAWPWTRIAALVAPRPLFFVNSDQDAIFPMDANERVINQLERVYSLYGAGDVVDSLASIGGHSYRKDIRQAVFRFLNTHLKKDPRPVLDSEIDLVVEEGNERRHPIDPESLRVFPHDSDLPQNQLNTTIDQHFVPLAMLAPAQPANYSEWKAQLLTELRRVSFRGFPETIPPGRPVGIVDPGGVRLETEPGIGISLRLAGQSLSPDQVKRVWVVVSLSSPPSSAEYLTQLRQPGDLVYVCEPRGVGLTRWTAKSPPNYVARAHVLLGRTVDVGRIWDLMAAAGYCQSQHGQNVPVYLAGEAAGGVLAAYAALLDPAIQGVVLSQPPASHRGDAAPSILNILRVSDLPQVLGMLAPRSLTILGGAEELHRQVSALYRAAQAPDKLTVR